MKPQNILGNEMHIRRPVPATVVGVDGREVIEQGVDPDVNRVCLVTGHLDPPVCTTRAGDWDIIETFADTIDHLVTTNRWLDKIGLLGHQPQEWFSVVTELEKIVLFAFADQRLVVERALVLVFLGLAFRDVLFLAGIVPAFVVAEVHRPALDQLGDVALDLLGVPRLAGADEIIVAEFEPAEGVLERLRVLVGPFLGGQVPLGGGVDHLGRVLVGAGEKEHVLALEPVVAGENIRDGRGVDMPDMRPVVHVIDWRGDVELVHGTGAPGILAGSPNEVNER